MMVIVYYIALLCSLNLVQSQNQTTKVTTSAPSSTTAAQNVSNDLTASASQPRAIKSRAVAAFTENFALCKRNAPEFDKCVRDGLNNAKSYIPKGIPELNIPAFDPIHAKEVVLKRGGPTFGYKLKLKNVMESGWRLSDITKFKSNLKLNTVQLTQYFPDKYLEGEYEFESMILSPNFNKGQFNLSLCTAFNNDAANTTVLSEELPTSGWLGTKMKIKFVDVKSNVDELNQTTTLSKPRNSKSIKVNVDVQEIGDMKLHISNLLRGRTRMENLLDRMINSPAWRPGFVVVRPFVNELVSTAFTEIYNKVFNNFDFDIIFPPA